MKENTSRNVCGVHWQYFLVFQKSITIRLKTSKMKYRHQSWASEPLFLSQKGQLCLTPLVTVCVGVMPEIDDLSKDRHVETQQVKRHAVQWCECCCSLMDEKEA
jgi:hypothetical protein